MRTSHFGRAGGASNHILLILFLAALALIVLPSCSKPSNGGLFDRVVDHLSGSRSAAKPIREGPSGDSPTTALPAAVPTTSTALPPSDDGGGVVTGLGEPLEGDGSYVSDPGGGQANADDPGPTTSVPEPATLLLFLSAGSLAVCLRRRKPG